MGTQVINPDFYWELNQLEDHIMGFVEENGPHSLSDSGITKIIKEKITPKWADGIEVTNDDTMLYVRLLLGDDYDSDIQLSFNFYAQINGLYTPLLKSNIQDIRDDLEKQLDSFISQIHEEGKFTPTLKTLLHETIEKVLKWIKYDSYDTDMDFNPNTRGYLVINLYSGSTYISFHFDL